MDHRTLNELAGELQAVFDELGLDARVEADRTRAGNRGEVLVDVDGRTLRAIVATRADLRPVHARDLPELEPGEAGVLLADRVAENSRLVLADRGWGWLDRRRGRFRIWAPGLRIDAEVAPRVAPPAEKPGNPFTPAGQAVALWLLVHPEQSASPRGLARELGVSASQVSNLLKALAGHGLLRRDRRPLVPELFWALAEHWRPQRHPLVALPSPAELAGSPELRSDAWVVSDTVAAAAYGVGVVTAPDYPPDLYLPDERSLSWLLGRSVRAPEHAQRSATVAVAPVALVCDVRLRLPGEPWPLAHPVVVALDLAADRGRGRELLEGWDPADLAGAGGVEVQRVW